MNTAPENTGPQATSAKWGQERRLEFIDFRLQWDGRLNRIDLMDFFGISKPQASLDIARYIELAPSNLTYDRGTRMYVAAAAFEPTFASSLPAPYLDRLRSATSGVPDGLSFAGWRPPVATVPVPGRELVAGVLSSILRAIREEQQIFVQYQSMTGTSGEGRWLSPHALAHDGYRWHVRAFCHLRTEFRDFLIARIISVGESLPNTVSATLDLEWHNMVSLVLAPHPRLGAAAAKIIEQDFGMKDGEVAMECRQALLFYFLRQLNLNSTSADATPQSQQIVLKNYAEINRLMRKESSN